MPLIGSADQPTATSRGSEETSTTSPGEQVVFPLSDPQPERCR